MNRIHLVCLLLLMAAVTGCSGLKTYPDTAEKNLLVRTKTSGSLFMSVEVFLHIYDLKDDCKSDYLGSIKLKNGETQIGIPTGRPAYLGFVFHTDGIVPDTTILTPRPGARYIADVRYADRIYSVTMHEAGPQGKLGREIERQARNCPDSRSLPEYR
jgi:hypothetical protein